VRRVSVIIPTLNEESTIGALFDSLSGEMASEVIIVDGGSTDRTREIAAQRGGRVLQAPQGRASQMNTGAAAATGDILLFLHSDVMLEQGALRAIASSTPGSAGTLRIHFAGDDWVAATFNWIYRARLPFGVFYGDTGIWVDREVWDRLGPYRDFPIMEDYEYARRLFRTTPLSHLESRVFVSPRRWRNGGLLKALTVWVLIQGGYSLGVHPKRLAWMYQQIR
jgi:rSAM/selenodomain-associated transferase 2